VGIDFVKAVEKNKSVIAKKWFEMAIQAYEPDTAEFLKSQKDQFANPVGNNTFKGLQGLLDQLLEDLNPEKVVIHLDPIIRIRAAQAFTPSQATAFVLSLKTVLKEKLGKQLRDEQMMVGYLEFEAKIDRLCLMAFDNYMECKEKIYQISANETRNRTFKAFERAGLIDATTQDPDKKKKTVR
jgi:hypothetical protein